MKITGDEGLEIKCDCGKKITFYGIKPKTYKCSKCNNKIEIIEKKEKKKYVLVRTYSAGVFAGYLM
jgi:hypothetical protein